MKIYNFKDAPLKVYGINFDEQGRIYRIPASVAQKVNEITAKRTKNAVGGRVRFKTNADVIEISIKLASNNVDWAMPISGSVGADVFVGKGLDAKRIGNIAPRDYSTTEFTGKVIKSAEMETVTINLPRNEPVVDLYISVDDKFSVQEPDDYTYTKPIVYYGSSITEGGCASAPGSAYTSIVSRWLDSDYVNLGFSNAAHGELAAADYIAGLDMSVLVMDYDYNAASVAELEATHEPFFARIRKAQPELPIVFISSANFKRNVEVNSKRREVIKKTYENAKAVGDNKVWFIDGEILYGDFDQSLCTVERVHPNDLGFMMMAKNIYPTIKEIIE